jgi:hypothetical protein
MKEEKKASFLPSKNRDLEEPLNLDTMLSNQSLTQSDISININGDWQLSKLEVIK